MRCKLKFGWKFNISDYFPADLKGGMITTEEGVVVSEQQKCHPDDTVLGDGMVNWQTTCDKIPVFGAVIELIT